MIGLSIAMLMAACQPVSPPGAPAAGAIDPTARGGAQPDGAALEFRGRRPCVDCLAIDSWLRLEQSDAAQGYRLIEHYRGQDREQRFEEVGEWRADGDLLRLQSSTGGERVYVRLPNQSLQARGIGGQRISALEDDVMIPTTFDNAR